tara:strand:- start:5250 stop:5471 length:222 start_codon:yes stop_codon:yes gene_type:complete
MVIINKLFFFWFYAGLISVLLLPFRNDWYKIQVDLKRLFFKSPLHFFVSSVIAYLFMPFILIDSLINIFRNDV